MKIKVASQADWLASSTRWKDGVGTGWVGTKLLGTGSQGVAGLWELPAGVQPEKTTRKVVVKQAGPGAVEGLLREGGFLSLFAKAGIKHIVKMYRAVIEDKGQGTNEKFDRKKRVAKMFLEFCAGGDFSGFLTTMLSYVYPSQIPLLWRYLLMAAVPMPEQLVWLIFECLALGLYAMEYGTESMNDTKWDKEIVHFDLKPENC